jgi:5-carboxymethyl-2-hydroxymuconate isomerase
MPHFVLDCSDTVLQSHDEASILQQVYQVAVATQLFDESDIKVRLNPYKTYLVGSQQSEFIHVYADIMEGRSTAQKADLSRRVVQKLCEIFPHINKIAMNVRDFEKASYCSRTML